MDIAEPSTNLSQEEKLKKALAIHREKCREHKRTKKEELTTALRNLADTLRQQAVALDQQREQLSQPPPYSLLKDLHQHGALIFLGDDDDFLELEGEGTGIAFAPAGGEPYDEYNPASDLIIDCYDVELRVDFTFKACGYKLQDKEKYKAPDPLHHLDAALKAANLPFEVMEMSPAISVKEWVRGLKSRAECKLENEDIDYDHHYPTKARGKGYLNTTITVMRLRS
jgi:hypothetical protein